MRNLQTVVADYITCMLWADLRDEDGESLDEYGYEDCSPELLKEAEADCASFITDVVMSGLDAAAWTDEQFGHDFWLTRNGHGTGFWDRGHGPVGDALTKLAKCYSTRSPYVGDDGKVHCE